MCLPLVPLCALLHLTLIAVAQQALLTTPTSHGWLSSDSLTIYTDGSFLPSLGHGAWACACLNTTSTPWRNCGILTHQQAGSLPESWDHPPSSPLAELTAAIWTVVWLLSCPPETAELCTDSALVVQVVSGRVGPVCLLSQPVVLLQSLLSLLRTRCSVSVRHTKAHSGEAWNEVVDGVARATAATPHLSATELPVHILGVTPWEWLPHAPSTMKNALPTVAPNGIVLAMPRVEPSLPAVLQEQREQTLTRQYELRIGTFNARSLGSKKGAVTQHDRAVLLRTHMAAFGYDIVGLQETRCPASHKLTDGWLVFASGHKTTRGHSGGCEIWIRAVQRWRRDCFRVVHAHPRCLILHYDDGVTKLTLCSAHALDSSYQVEDREEWWCSLAEHLAFSAEIILMIDANARICSACPLEDLCHCAQAAHDNRNFLRGLMQAHRLQLLHDPSTASPTWKVGTAHEARLDHILVSGQLTHTVLDVDWHEDMDPQRLLSDHVLTGARILLAFQGKLQQDKWEPKFPQRALRDPARRERFASLLRQFQHPPWQTAVDAHQRALGQHVLRSARAAFQTPRRPHRPHLTNDTLQRVLAARKLRRTTRALLAGRTLPSAGLGTELLELISTIRKSGSELRNGGEEAIREISGQLQAGMVPPASTLYILHRSVGKLLSYFILEDKRLAVQHFLSEAPTGGGPWSCINALRRLVGAGRRRATQALPLLRDQAGHACLTVRDAARRFLTHFAEQERSQPLQPQLFMDRGTNMPLLPPSWDYIPDRDALCRQFARARTDKASDMEGLNDAYFVAAPDVMAELYFPLHLKLSLASDRPSTYTGALLQPLPKPSGDLTTPGGFRSIALASIVAKHHQAWLRRSLLTFAEGYLYDTQQGGLPGRSTEFSHMHLTTFRSVFHAKRINCALLFVDLAAAFHGSLRALLTRSLRNSPDAGHLLTDMETWPGSAALLRGLLESPSVLDQAQVPLFLQQQVALEYTNTWATVRSAGCGAHTLAGSRPGVPLADICFNLSFRPVLQESRAFLLAHQLAPLLPASESAFPVLGDLPDCTVVEATFMDDLVIPFVTAKAALLPEATKVIGDFLATCLRPRGWRMNYSVKKTAALLQPAGQGARQLRRHLHEQQQDLSDATLVPFADSYKHLGSLTARSVLPGVAVAAKVKAHASALFPFKRVAKLRQLSCRHTYIFYKATACSVLFHNLHVLEGIAASHLKRLDGAMHNAYGHLLQVQSRKGAARASQHALRQQLAAPSAELQLRCKRLTFLPRLLRAGPATLRGLLAVQANSNSGWVALLSRDISHMRSLLELSLPPPSVDLAVWLEAAVGEEWKGWVRVYSRVAPAHSLDVLGLEELGLVIDASLGRAVSSTPQLQCPYCTKTAKDASGLSLHITKAHPTHHPLARVTSGSVCQACMTEFHTIARLHVHLKRQHRCRLTLFASVPPLSDHDCEAVVAQTLGEQRQQQRTGRHGCYAEAPAIRLPGPPICPAPPGFQASEPAPAAVSVPRPSPGASFPSRGCLVLSLFSGCRRDTDIQAHFETQDTTGRFLFLSLDIANHPERGDLTSLKVLASIEEWFQAGWVGAVILAPPCETWSAARSRQVDGKPHAPRPLRHAKSPWGLPFHTLRPRELEQLLLGNRFMRLCLSLLARCAAMRLPCLMEHPATPNWCPQAASCWRTPQFERLLAQGSVQLHRIDQCAFGTPYMKPTGLGAACFPELGDALRAHPCKGRCVHTSHEAPLAGLDEKGGFATAAAKCYPADMCRLVAHSLFTALVTKGDPAQPAATLPTAVRLHHAPLRQYAAGPDFTRRAAAFASR